jgi:hypothetical protein
MSQKQQQKKKLNKTKNPKTIMIIAALFTIVKTWNQAKRTSTDE